MTEPGDEAPYAVIPQPLGLFAGDLHRLARDYLEAARLVGVGIPSKLISPTYYLLSVSVELSLKAFLATIGMTKQHLRKIGHDLPELMRSSVAAGMPSVEHLDVLVRHLMTINTDQNLRYPAGQILSVLRFDQASQIAHELHQTIEVAVKPAYLRARLDHLKDYRGRYVQWSD